MKERRVIQLKVTLILSLILILAMISGCAVTKSARKKRAEGGFEKRLRMYVHAMSVNDFNFTYSLESKALRERMTYDEYVKAKHSTNAENEIYKVSRIQYDKVKDQYIVNVKVILVNIPNIARLTISDMRGEIWKFDGDGYYRVGPAKKMRFITKKKKKASDKEKSKDTEDEKKSSVKKKRK